MSTDIDFDELLAELDEPTESTEPHTQNQLDELLADEVTPIDEVVALVDDVEQTEEEMLADDKIYAEDNEFVAENVHCDKGVDKALTEVVTIKTDNTDVITNMEEELNKVKLKNQELMEKHIASSNPVDVPSEAESYFRENMDLYQSYIREVFEYEAKLKLLKDDFKDVQDDFKDKGISIGSVKKAIRNIKESLKENSEDAAAVVGVEQMLTGDANFMAELTSQVAQ